MTGKTHFTSSILTISAVCITLHNPIHAVLFAAGNFYGSLIPDIDIENSVGRSVFPITSHIYDAIQGLMKTSNAKETIFGHRGIMHSILFPILFYLLAKNSGEMLSYLFFGIFSGYVLHLILDFLTSGKKGLALLSPVLRYRFKFPIYIKTNGLFEMLILHSMEVLSLFIITFFSQSGLSVLST